MSSIPPITQISGSHKYPEGEQLQHIVDDHCKDYPRGIGLGCNLLVMHGKEAKLYRAGDIPINGPINWGSVSKQFTAACIDILVKQGKIKYNDDIRKLCPDLPEFKLNGEVQKVTVDDLLHMQSGLPEVWATALMKAQDAEKLENLALLDLLGKHPGMVFAPGTKFMYCNTNYYVLAKIVEHVSDEPFPDFVRNQVLEPLKMVARCSIDPSAPQTIPGYEFQVQNWKEVTSENKSYGTTGLIGPPTDMKAWNDSIARREYDLLEPPKNNRESYCRGVIVDYVDDYTVIYHGGALSGANTIYRRYEHCKDPTKTFAIFLTTNADCVPATELTANNVVKAITGKDLTRQTAQEEVLPKWIATHEDLQPFCGKFRCLELKSEWQVNEKDLSLSMKPSDGSLFPNWIFTPQIKDEKFILGSDGYGKPIIESTSTGFTLFCNNIAPLHFDRY